MWSSFGVTQVQIIGVTRSSEDRSSFVPDNDPAKGEWYWLDVPALAKAAGLPPDTDLVQVLWSHFQMVCQACQMQKDSAPLHASLLTTSFQAQPFISQPFKLSPSYFHGMICVCCEGCHGYMKEQTELRRSSCKSRRNCVEAATSSRCLPPNRDFQAMLPMQVISEGQGSAARTSAPTSMELMAMRTRTSTPQEQYPLPRTVEDLMTFSVMPYDHRNYALTWFSLAGATALLALRAGRLKK